MPEPLNDILTVAEELIYDWLAGDTALVSLVGTNSETGQPNIYYQRAEDGAGDLCVIFDDSSEETSIDYAMGAEIVDVQVVFLVKALAPRERMSDLRKASSRIHAALHRRTGSTADGQVLECMEQRPLVLPAFTEEGIRFAQRGGKYELILQPAG